MINKQHLTYLLLFCSTFITAQTLSDFENISLAPESFLNGSDENGGFTNGNLFLPNSFTDEFGYDSWSGWAISNVTDISTPGFGNQYAAITGSGVENSNNYAISYVPGGNSASRLILQNEAAGEAVPGFYITNSTYTYLEILSAPSGFSKAFGGPTGNDPDYFFLTIKKYKDGTLSADSIDFYLADYRFNDNSQDYIIDEWTFIDLSSLGAADSLSFTLTSSDTGMFGINTPTYFCVDNVTTSDGTTAVHSTLSETMFEVYPNPTSDFIILKNIKEESLCSIYDLHGNLLLSQKVNTGLERIDVRTLVAGAYIVVMENGGERNGQILLIK